MAILSPMYTGLQKRR